VWRRAGSANERTRRRHPCRLSLPLVLIARAPLEPIASHRRGSLYLAPTIHPQSPPIAAPVPAMADGTASRHVPHHGRPAGSRQTPDSALHCDMSPPRAGSTDGAICTRRSRSCGIGVWFLSPPRHSSGLPIPPERDQADHHGAPVPGAHALRASGFAHTLYTLMYSVQHV
jgi:hypothetical protein